MTTLKDVAKLAGVHPSVVSRVLNNNDTLHIKPETRQRIMDAVRESNYEPNQAARNLKNKETKMLAIIIPDFSNPVYAEIIKGAEKEAIKKGYTLIVSTLQQEKKNMTQQLLSLQTKVDGLLIGSITNEQEMTRTLNKFKKPFVIFNREVESVNNSVLLDDLTGSRIATEYLIELGHEKIAHIAGPLFTSTGLMRLKGYRESLNKYGLEYHAHFVQESDYSLQGGFAATKRLLQDQTGCTAIFASNILIALGVLEALHSEGIRVPEDISVVGFHDVFFANTIHPPLTTVELPLSKLGEVAVEKLIATLKGEHVIMEEKTIITGGKLIERSSVKRIKR
ncbi:LacI family DNA-binding transcriptional regulator [Lysinibacillus sp. FSL K6-0232]|uniref:LacI family DNA-binding transcriptional regulator n=1 Tax=unclassified Lysinibacillus TaxID=2636778 RepID=UPI0030F653C4